MDLLVRFFMGSSLEELWNSGKFSIIKDVTITQKMICQGSFGVVYNAVYAVCG